VRIVFGWDALSGGTTGLVTGTHPAEHLLLLAKDAAKEGERGAYYTEGEISLHRYCNPDKARQSLREAIERSQPSDCFSIVLNGIY